MVLVLCVIPVAQARAGTVIMGKAQAAYLVAHAVTDTVPPSPGVSNWPDVPAGSFCSDEINYCHYQGLIGGELDGLYHPERQVTRGKMAEYTARVVNNRDGDLSAFVPPTDASFSDVPTSDPAYLYVEYIESKGVISVDPEGLFHPSDLMDMYDAADWLETITGRYVDPVTIPAMTGTVTGIVTDVVTGAPIAGAHVYFIYVGDMGSISNGGDPTGADGTYTYDIATMAYDRVEAEADGYYSTTAPGVTVTGGSVIQVDFQLYHAPIDIPQDNWAFDAVKACVEAGIVSGYEDGTYKPTLPVTRDQMAVYISRALAGGDSDVPDFTATPTFPDVGATHWALRHIEYAVAQGVVAGYDDGNYHPEYEVTRDQMAVYVARALVAPSGEAGLADYVPADPRNFPDVPDTFWAYKHIEYCVEHDVVNGYEDGYYYPDIVVTRDQMAVYVARAFGL
jgi:hypothetical protein